MSAQGSAQGGASAGVSSTPPMGPAWRRLFDEIDRIIIVFCLHGFNVVRLELSAPQHMQKLTIGNPPDPSPKTFRILKR